MINIVQERTSSIKTIKPDDPNFKIHNGFMTANRAGLNISQSCPNSYSMIILEAISKGWLTPVAYMTTKEMMVAGLLSS